MLQLLIQAATVIASVSVLALGIAVWGAFIFVGIVMASEKLIGREYAVTIHVDEDIHDTIHEI